MPGRCSALLIKLRVFFEGSVLFNDTLVDIRNLHFNYDGRPVLEGIDMKIPRGKVASYGQIAALIPPPPGLPPEEYERYRARWAGAAMALSPADVPWQRVINSQGKISLKGEAAQKQRLRLVSRHRQRVGVGADLLDDDALVFSS